MCFGEGQLLHELGYRQTMEYYAASLMENFVGTAVGD